MLRIAPGPPGPPQAGGPPQAPSGPPQGGPPPELLAQLAAASQGAQDAPPKKGSKKFSVDKVDPDTAGYLGPEDGPFQCARCHHFDGQGSCDVVAGPIDPEGCCNLFTVGDEAEGSSDGQEETDEAPPSGGGPPPPPLPGQ